MSAQDGDDAAATKGKKVHLSVDDYRILVSWMEDEANAASINGATRKTTVGEGKTASKLQGYANMAAHLDRHTKNKALSLLPAKNMKSRWETYKNKFFATRRSSRQTGWGLSQAEKDKGISIQEKLDRLCPFYMRMDALIGKKANKTPAGTVELGLPPRIAQDTAAVVTPDAEGTDVNEHPAATSEQLAQQEARHDSVAVVERDGSAHDDADAAANEPDYDYDGIGLSSDDEERLLTELLAEATVPAIATPPAAEEGITEAARETQARANAGTATTAARPSTKRASSDTTTPAPKIQKTQPQTASEGRMSLSAAYAKNSEAKVDYLKDKLAIDRRQWKLEQQEARRMWEASQAAQERKFQLDAEQRDREMDDRAKARKQQLIIELVRQQKPASEIEALVKLLAD